MLVPIRMMLIMVMLVAAAEPAAARRFSAAFLGVFKVVLELQRYTSREKINAQSNSLHKSPSERTDRLGSHSLRRTLSLRRICTDRPCQRGIPTAKRTLFSLC